MTMKAARRTLEEYLSLQYPFQAIADPDGGYVVVFPDLPGCMTQAESMDEIPSLAEDARRLWIETVYASGEDVPLPSLPEEHSGKFNVRLPRSLHRALVEAAERDGVSLNQYVVAVLARGDAQARLEKRLEHVAIQIESLHSRKHGTQPADRSKRSRQLSTATRRGQRQSAKA